MIAMREWFLARYQDPAFGTPFNDGDYYFVDGGPYDPADVLSERFGSIVENETIQELIDELHSEVGDEWAPSMRDPQDEDFAFDERLEISPSSESAGDRLRTRLSEIRRLLAIKTDADMTALILRLAFGAAIGAVESFLWETAAFFVAKDEQTFQDIVTKIPALREREIKLGDIFKSIAGLKQQVNGYLQNFVWHRFEKVAQLFRSWLGIEPPSFNALEAAVIKRHDIVHRSGHDVEGNPVVVAQGDVTKLCDDIEAFANELSKRLAEQAANVSKTS
jgi:hypothetical protein